VLETVESNLTCLTQILKFNAKHSILFFRITSDLVPFASHPVCKSNWPRHFESEFQVIGDLVRRWDMRISMHPDQFTLLNSVDDRVAENSVRELEYHAQVLDLMELDTAAKIQIHVGGVYGDKGRSMERFAERFERLNESLKGRLVVENDDHRYSVQDCLSLGALTGAPVLFDVFHHEVNTSGESTPEALGLCAQTWKPRDGLPMVDYSSQRAGHRVGTHAETINVTRFGEFLDRTHPYDFDVMLEVKDKEASALKAIQVALPDKRMRVAPR
jgi:UV DNA damage endonuclease